MSNAVKSPKSEAAMTDFSRNTQSLVVGDYVLTKQIGSGSFSIVWRAMHRFGNGEAAIKEIPTAKLSPKLMESLESEIRILQKAEHPNIVKLLDIIRSPDRIFLILEYCAGGDLSHFIKNGGPVDEACAQHFMRQLGAGLQILRANNLVHRDLKPQNLLLSSKSKTAVLKIADFGFARSLHPQGLAETLCGSPLYMAPEILQCQKYDAKADLWSVGAILFELLVGRPPFGGQNHVHLLQNIKKSEAKIPKNIELGLSAECTGLIKALLKRNPVERLSFDSFFRHPFLNLRELDFSSLADKSTRQKTPTDTTPAAHSPLSSKSASEESNSLQSTEPELPFGALEELNDQENAGPDDVALKRERGGERRGGERDACAAGERAGERGRGGESVLSSSRSLYQNLLWMARGGKTKSKNKMSEISQSKKSGGSSGSGQGRGGGRDRDGVAEEGGEEEWMIVSPEDTEPHSASRSSSPSPEKAAVARMERPAGVVAETSERERTGEEGENRRENIVSEELKLVVEEERLIEAELSGNSRERKRERREEGEKEEERADRKVAGEVKESEGVEIIRNEERKRGERGREAGERDGANASIQISENNEGEGTDEIAVASSEGGEKKGSEVKERERKEQCVVCFWEEGGDQEVRERGRERTREKDDSLSEPLLFFPSEDCGRCREGRNGQDSILSCCDLDTLPFSTKLTILVRHASLIEQLAASKFVSEQPLPALSLQILALSTWRYAIGFCKEQRKLEKKPPCPAHPPSFPLPLSLLPFAADYNAKKHSPQFSAQEILSPDFSPVAPPPFSRSATPFPTSPPFAPFPYKKLSLFCAFLEWRFVAAVDRGRDYVTRVKSLHSLHTQGQPDPLFPSNHPAAGIGFSGKFSVAAAALVRDGSVEAGSGEIGSEKDGFIPFQVRKAENLAFKADNLGLGLGSDKTGPTISQPQPFLPDPIEVVYQSALRMGRAAAVDEMSGNFSSALSSYSASSYLFQFLLLVAPCLLPLRSPPPKAFSLSPAQKDMLRKYHSASVERRRACEVRSDLTWRAL